MLQRRGPRNSRDGGHDIDGVNVHVPVNDSPAMLAAIATLAVRTLERRTTSSALLITKRIDRLHLPNWTERDARPIMAEKAGNRASISLGTEMGLRSFQTTPPARSRPRPDEAIRFNHNTLGSSTSCSVSFAKGKASPLACSTRSRRPLQGRVIRRVHHRRGDATTSRARSRSRHVQR